MNVNGMSFRLRNQNKKNDIQLNEIIVSNENIHVSLDL